MSGATEFQFGVHVSGSLDQKIEQLERELRLLRFSREDFPPLDDKVSFAGTNRLMSECLADLSAKIGKPIPMELGTNDFKAKEFVFERIPLMDALKYLVAFNDAILDVSGGKLVCKPVRQALSLNEPEYEVLHLMSLGRFQEAEQLLAQGPLDVQKVKDQDGHSLLHLAAAKNQTAIAERLIALGANLNVRDNVGYTPLHEAVRDGKKPCAEFLLKHGADPTIPDNNNSTPLQTAIYFGFQDIGRSLVSNGAPVDIFTAAGAGMADRVKKMLDDGVDYRKLQSDYINKDRPVDITKPGWSAQLAHSPHPFDEAGTRPEGEDLLRELIGFYRASGDDERQAIRALFVEYRAFAWAVTLPFGPTDEDKLLQHLLLFSLKDQGRDSRDALLWLQDICREARSVGLQPDPVLREVAKLSSDKNKYGMGSTREMLLHACAA